MTEATKSPLKLLVFLLCGAITFGVVWASLSSRAGEGTEVQVHMAPVIYDSFTDAASQADAVLAITIVSQPSRYKDFGGDGKPDYRGQPGLPVELLDAHVDDVLQGDTALAGTLITMSQTPIGAMTGDNVEDSMIPGKKYVVIAFRGQTNPGVGAEGGVEAWNTPLAGQGVFNLSAKGVVSSPVIGIFPETFGPDGKGHITMRDLSQPISRQQTVG